MPALAWAAVAVAGLWGGGYTLEKFNELVGDSSKYLIAGGVLYVGYKAAKKGKLL
jgi:hypothetical protein